MPTDWPALLIGMLVAGYWARVLRLVVKVRKQTGRAGNFWPAEPLGRVLRIVWYPAVVAWIVHPLMHAFWPQPGVLLRGLYWQPLVQYPAVAVAAAAFVATWVCWKKMGKSWRMGIDPGEKTQLVVTGPYAYVRHPIYALQCVFAIASLAAVPTPLMGIVVAIVVLLLQWEARREEQYLLRIHGEVYARYLATVGRFIPRSISPAHATAL